MASLAPSKPITPTLMGLPDNILASARPADGLYDIPMEPEVKTPDPVRVAPLRRSRAPRIATWSSIALIFVVYAAGHVPTPAVQASPVQDSFCTDCHVAVPLSYSHGGWKLQHGEIMPDPSYFVTTEPPSYEYEDWMVRFAEQTSEWNASAYEEYLRLGSDDRPDHGAAVVWKLWNDFLLFQASMPLAALYLFLLQCCSTLIIALMYFFLVTTHNSLAFVFDYRLLSDLSVRSLDSIFTGFLSFNAKLYTNCTIRSYISLSYWPVMYWITTRCVTPYLRRKLTSTPVSKKLEYDLKISMNSDTGKYSGTTELLYTPFYAWYPTFAHGFGQTPWCFVRTVWNPIERFQSFISADVSVDVSKVTDAVVARLSSASTSLPAATTQPTSVLEMAVPNSKRVKTKAPKSMGIIHCAEPGASDLSAGGRIYACLGRVSHEGKSYGVTATHVVRDLMPHVRAGRTIYLRYKGMDHVFPLQDMTFHSMSPVNSLDTCLIDVPASVWSTCGMKTSKVSLKVRARAPIQVYTPTASGNWTHAHGLVLKSSGLFRFFHTASTDYGASGSLVLSGNAIIAVHHRRSPSPSVPANIASSFIPFFPKEKVLETAYYYEDDLWRPQEPQWEEDEEEGKQDESEFDRRRRLEYEDDMMDQYDEMQRVASVYSKQDHREYHASNRRTYTEAEREAHYHGDRHILDTPFGGDLLEASKPRLTLVSSSTPSLDVQKLQADRLELDSRIDSEFQNSLDDLGKTLSLFGTAEPQSENRLGAPSARDQEEAKTKKQVLMDKYLESAKAKTTPKPPAPLLELRPQRPPIKFLKDQCTVSTPSSVSSEVIDGQKEVPEKTMIVIESSAPPSADSPGGEGPGKKKRRRRRKRKSKALPVGTQQTPQLKPLGAHSTTKPIGSLKEPSPALTTSEKSPPDSSLNTPQLPAPKASAKTLSTSKSYATALSGL